MDFYNDFNLTTAILQFTIPNFYTGCYVLDALLQSDLSCFYNISCLNEVQLYLSTNISLTINFTLLNSSFESQYNETTTINELMQQLMIENWNIEVNYIAYFKSCKPSSCTYSLTSRNNILYIITTVFGLIGGVTIVLYFLVPFIIEFIRRRKQPVSALDQTLTIRQSHLQILRFWVKQKLVTLNIFEDVRSNDEYHLRNQILATRLFIILLIISMFFFALYSSLIVITKTDTVAKPLLDHYLKLEQKYQSKFTQNLLQTQTNEFILLFQLATQTSFNLSLTMIRQTTQANQLECGLTPNGGFEPIRDNISSELVPYTNIFFLDDNAGYCYCKYNLGCKVGLHIQSCPVNCLVDLADLSFNAI